MTDHTVTLLMASVTVGEIHRATDVTNVFLEHMDSPVLTKMDVKTVIAISEAP